MTAKRDEIVRIRMTKRERERALKVADKLATSMSAAYRQAMNLLHDQLFPERGKAPPGR